MLTDQPKGNPTKRWWRWRLGKGERGVNSSYRWILAMRAKHPMRPTKKQFRCQEPQAVSHQPSRLRFGGSGRFLFDIAEGDRHAVGARSQFGGKEERSVALAGDTTGFQRIGVAAVGPAITTGDLRTTRIETTRSCGSTSLRSNSDQTYSILRYRVSDSSRQTSSLGRLMEGEAPAEPLRCVPNFGSPGGSPSK